MWVCPECKFISPSGGACPCSESKTYTVNLVEVEEEDMGSAIIKYVGNLERFAGQTSAVLLSADLQIVREIKPELRDHVGESCIPRGSAIRCVYLGEKGIPFVELRNYGSAALSRLKEAVGQRFTIDAPATGSQPIPLNFSGEQ